MTKKALIGLKSIILAGTASAGFALAKQADVAPLITDGLVEVNTTIAPDANGMVQVRATDKLKAESAAPATGAPAELVAKPVFAIDSGIVPVDGVRGGVKEEVYPFSKLEVGQSFVVPVSADKPTPADVVEKFSSTVSSATRRFAEKSATETKTNRKGETVAVLVATRKFTLRPVTAGQTYAGSTFVEPVSGARVFRTA